MSASPSQRSRRQLALLGVTALILAAVAVFLRVKDYQDVSANFAPHLLFPQLSEQINTVTRVSIRTSNGSFNIVRQDDGEWVLPGKAGYAADGAAVRQLLLALKDLKLIEAKTASAEYYERIGVRTPQDGGTGFEVSVFAGKGAEPLADGIVGNRQYRGGGEDAFYVRLPGQAQTWLAQGRLSPKPLQTDWLDKTVVPFQRSDFQSVSVAPADGRAYQISRGPSEDEGFTLTPPPGPGKEVSRYDLSSALYALTTLSIEDVKKLDDLVFDPAAQPTGSAEYRLVDGTVIRGDFSKSGDKYWVRFKVTGGTAKDAERQAQVQSLKKQVEGWAFELASYKYSQIMRPFNDLVRESKKKSPPSLKEPRETPQINLGPNGDLP